MAEIEAVIGRQFQSLSIVFVRADEAGFTFFGLEFSLQIYMELTGASLRKWREKCLPT
jgi:hypothetical protein